MRTAVITGISSGIGQAIAKALEAAGYEVVGVSRQDVDLNDMDKVANFGERLTQEHKQIDVLIHVAGVWHDDAQVLADKSLGEFSSQQITETMNVGVTSFMVLAAALLPNMPKDGMVIGTTGTFAEGGAGWLPYYTSKRALEDFLVGLAQDYPEGPEVFGVSPADTATPAYKKFYPQYADEAQSPEVIASFCLDLLQHKSEYKTGDIIEVRDGNNRNGFHK